MKLTEEDVNRIIEKLKPRHTCPLCGKSSWIVGDTVCQLEEFRPQRYAKGKKAMPVIPIICKNCGNTYFLNIVILGVISGEN